jgi:serine/threonine-protein kinase
MEYVEGKTIYDDLSAGKVFSEDKALEIIIQVAHALAHAHAKGLIHRDVKPKNIMINSAGVVKLADMGLARATTDIEAAKTEKGKAYGTPYYIAPEQIRGEVDIDGRADIYGLGATFYHMVTGRVPFMADDPTDVMRKHLREQLIPPDHINTSLSAGTSEVIEVMMAKRKESRYDSADELLADLQAVRDGQAPMRAHTRFDISVLERLEQGEDENSQIPHCPGDFRCCSSGIRFNHYVTRFFLLIIQFHLLICLICYQLPIANNQLSYAKRRGTFFFERVGHGSQPLRYRCNS